MHYRICANPDCTRAGQALPLTDFYPNRVGKKVYYRNTCKVCVNQANTERHRRNMSTRPIKRHGGNPPSKVIISRKVHPHDDTWHE